MVEINIKGKGLNQKIFSKKDVRATVGRKSRAFNAIMKVEGVGKVVDKVAEKRVLYESLKKRGQAAGERGITKKELKKVLGDIKGSRHFSHKEIHALGEALIGGSANSRIIHEHENVSHGNNKSSKAEIKQKRIIEARKNANEMISAALAGRLGAFGGKNGVGKIQQERLVPAQPEMPKRLTFIGNDNLIRKAQEKNLIANMEFSLSKTGHEGHEIENRYFRRLDKNDNADDIKSRLTQIQGKPDEDEDDMRLAA